MESNRKSGNTQPHRILFAGDGWCRPAAGMTPLVEAGLRFSQPGAPWRFWHLGEDTCTVRGLLDEAIRLLLGRDAQRILVSTGHAPSDREDPSAVHAATALLDLLADKLPGQAWILLPSPSLWPEASREACLHLREALCHAHPEVGRIDLEPEVSAFLSAQDPEHGAPLCQSGLLPTAAGALLAARAVISSWT